nr:tRNA threonylcarbamoyladenosine dehydratase [uncultured Holophaga sp.]
MLHARSRTERLLGAQALERLRGSRVAIFGVGGVGSHAAEALVRGGVGHFLLVDHDCICLTNLNRQLHATQATLGQYKVEAMKARMLEIDPTARIDTLCDFYNPGKAESMIPEGLDYILDCIDTVTGKLDLIQEAKRREIPIISAMGAGNKLDPTAFEVTDLAKTLNCPLAKVMRKELRKRGIRHLKVVYSQEEALVPDKGEDGDCPPDCQCPKKGEAPITSRRQTPGSVSFVPAVVGMIMAGEVIKDMIKGK